jgi:hypothetical protein
VVSRIDVKRFENSRIQKLDQRCPFGNNAANVYDLNLLRYPVPYGKISNQTTRG